MATAQPVGLTDAANGLNEASSRQTHFKNVFGLNFLKFTLLCPFLTICITDYGDFKAV